MTPTRPDDSGGTSGTASSSRAPAQTPLQQRLQGAFLTIIGLAGLIGGVLFSIEAPRFTPVPVVFLTFWLVMVIVGKVLFAGLGKLREAGVGAPAPQQVRAAAAVAGIVVAVGMMGFAATTAGTGTAVAAPCPGGGPATCGPTGPDLTFAPPTGQATVPGGQQGQQGGQDQQGIATSPSQGGDNGPGIQAQTPQFGTPGQQAPNIPGNEQPGQGGQQQPAQGQQTGQQGPVQTTAPGGPQQTGQQQPGQQTQSGQPSSPTVTVTKTESQCAVPGAGNGAGTPGSPGGGDSSSNSGGTGPDGDGENQDGAPTWAYLVGEASALMTGRRRPGSGSSQGPRSQDSAARELTEGSAVLPTSGRSSSSQVSLANTPIAGGAEAHSGTAPTTAAGDSDDDSEPQDSAGSSESSQITYASTEGEAGPYDSAEYQHSLSGAAVAVDASAQIGSDEETGQMTVGAEPSVQSDGFSEPVTPNAVNAPYIPSAPGTGTGTTPQVQAEPYTPSSGSGTGTTPQVEAQPYAPSTEEGSDGTAQQVGLPIAIGAIAAAAFLVIGAQIIVSNPEARTSWDAFSREMERRVGDAWHNSKDAVQDWWNEHYGPDSGSASQPTQPQTTQPPNGGQPAAQPGTAPKPPEAQPAAPAQAPIITTPPSEGGPVITAPPDSAVPTEAAPPAAVTPGGTTTTDGGSGASSSEAVPDSGTGQARNPDGTFAGGQHGKEAEAKELERYKKEFPDREVITRQQVVKARTENGEVVRTLPDGYAQLPDGTWEIIEVKSGSATLTPGQRALRDQIAREGSIELDIIDNEGNHRRITVTDYNVRNVPSEGR